VNPETGHTDPGTSHQHFGNQQCSGTSGLTMKLQNLTLTSHDNKLWLGSYNKVNVSAINKRFDDGLKIGIINGITSAEVQNVLNGTVLRNILQAT